MDGAAFSKAATLIAALLVIVPLIVTTPVPADAAAMNSCGYKSNISVEFAGSGFTTADKTNIMAGFKAWQNQVRTWSGNSAFTINEGGSGTKLTVRWVDYLAGSAWGIGLCSTMLVAFNIDHRDNLRSLPNKFRGLAAHDLGHVIGVDHVHAKDSNDGSTPLMWSCSVGQDAILRQDDKAAVQLLSDVSGAFRSGTANSSFEDPSYFQHWAILAGSNWNAVTGGADGSPRAVRFRHTSAESYIYSTTNLLDGPTIDLIKGRANFRKNASTDTGTVAVRIRVSKYTVGGSGCGTPSRRDGAISTGTETWRTVNCTPTAGWGWCDTGTFNPPGASTSSEGIQARVYLHNNMRAGSARTYVVSDRIRLMVDY